MRKLWKNTKGAVTVFVTLLLIPAILVSGTAVDLSRMHTARSIVQDANQLAANSLLTQYNAILQDIYGLYAVMESDPILGDMLNEYIQTAIFGEAWQDKQLGTFQLFYGSTVQPTKVTPVTNQNLRNADVLRRQIEEYAKFRAPIIIIEEIFERIESFKKLKADAEVIEQKMAIDDKIDEIDDIYQEIYNLINEINTYPSAEKSAFESINTYLRDINREMKALKTTRDDWTSAYDGNNDRLMDDVLEDAEKKYNAIKLNIQAITSGGNVGSGWIAGDYNDEGDWVNGKWSTTSRSNGLNQAIGDRKSKLNAYITKIEQLITKCEEADKKKAELAKMVDELEEKLNSGECSDEIVDGMTQSRIIRKNEQADIQATLPSVIEEYRSLLEYPLKPMAEAIKNRNESYINEVIEILDNTSYGSVVSNVLSAPFLSRDSLNSLSDQVFEVNLIVTKRAMPNVDTAQLNQLAALSNIIYSSPNQFKLFQSEVFNTTYNKEFYDVLVKRYSPLDDEIKKQREKKNQEKENASSLLKTVQEVFTAIPKPPQGAKYYKTDKGEAAGGFGNDGDWGDEKEAKKQTKKALNDNIITSAGDVLSNAGDKILLLTYATEMFSNYTTVSGEKTMSGVPISTDINYFFQSELEYLYHGNEKSAISNVATVSGLILLVRFVFNYTSTFLISELKYELWLISSAAGAYAGIVRELARLGYALAESALDMKELVAGRAVPIFKRKISEWTFSLHGSDESIPSTIATFIGKKQGNADSGMFYLDYLRILLLFKDDTELAGRVSNLISWNITNKSRGLEADEAAMANTELFDMSKAHTGFSINTTVELRMLFLSMPFAQKGVNGVIPPRTLPITVTDYRGY